jgi:DNA-binding MarR family transcriptional regulator
MASKELEALAEALNYLRHELRDPTLGTGMLLTLLSTALHEGSSQGDLSRILDLHPTAISKHVERLGDLDFAERRILPGKTQYEVWLTERGREAMLKIGEILAGKRSWPNVP